MWLLGHGRIRPALAPATRARRREAGPRHRLPTTGSSRIRCSGTAMEMDRAVFSAVLFGAWRAFCH